MAIDTSPSSLAHEAKAHTTLLLLALPAYTVHFKSPTYLQIHTLDLIDNKCLKTTLKESAGATSLSSRVREAIAGDARYWAEMRELVGAGVRGLERRSFANNILAGDAAGGGTAVDYESTSGALIASNYPGLWKDLERLNDLISISRNVLTVGAMAQDGAAGYTVEHAIFKLINCCVRVTARGYDGGGGAAAEGDAAAGRVGEEEKWQWIVNAYKKLLITCLQWLNNFAAGNEGAKLNLWAELFDSPSDSLGLDEEDGDGKTDDAQPNSAEGHMRELAPKSKDVASTKKKENQPPKKPSPPITNHDILLAYGTNGSSRISPLEMEGAIPLFSPPPPGSPPSLPMDKSAFKPLPTQIQALAKKNHYDANGYVYFTARFKGKAVEIYQRDHGRSPTLAEIHLAIPVLWEDERSRGGKEGGGAAVSAKKMWEIWQGGYDRAVREYHDEVDRWEKGLLDDVEGRKTIEAPAVTTPPAKDVAEYERKIERQRAKKIDVQVKVRVLEEKIKAELEKGEWMEVMNMPANQSTSTPAGQLGIVERTSSSTNNNDLTPSATKRNDAEKDNTQLVFDAQAGVKILESGKAELMKRLEGFAAEDESVVVTAADGVREPRGRRRRKERQSLSDAFADMGVDAAERKESGETKAVEERLKAEPLERQLTQPDRENIDELDDLDSNEEEDDDASDDEDEEEDYPGSSEDGRGLLTDVPLILGPSEIEVLPMLVMSGIYPSSSNSSSKSAVDLSQLTTHLLLTRTPGRNLLRELLIFVAAWDLREEELYFKFMVKIIEAVMERGLLPYLYWSLRDRSRSRDVISPAQAVVLKLGTSIFRQRRKEASSEQQQQQQQAADGTSAFPTTSTSQTMSQTDLHLLNFLFSEFRQHIIPQTCALIFLQGQIHRGRASAEDFPLNLWDMERMYEGVYQVLEFFAVCVEEPRRGGQNGNAVKVEENKDAAQGEVTWKGILSKWEMASELITLLRELESGIPKLSTAPAPAATASAPAVGKSAELRPPQQLQRSLSADDAATLLPPAEAAAADIDAESSLLPPLPSSDSGERQRVFEAQTPLAYLEDLPQAGGQASTSSLLPNPIAIPTNSALPAPLGAPPTGPPSLHDQDEPSDFEWRNLKKLTVLVLSSLIWKNSLVQDQVRKFGGLEALVAACRPDEHNPYIREHAIMCLRFAVEGNEKNAGVIKEMAREFAGSSGLSGPSEGTTELASTSGVATGSRTARADDGWPVAPSSKELPDDPQWMKDAKKWMRRHELMDKVSRMPGRERDAAIDEIERQHAVKMESLAGRSVRDADDIPGEVLDSGKYESFLDRKGQVGLRKKSDDVAGVEMDRSATASAPPGSSSSFTPLTATNTTTSTSSSLLSSTKMTAEKAAELMQNALRDLPLGEKLVTDRQKAEALARLDRAFERTERTLDDGSGVGGASGKKGGG